LLDVEISDVVHPSTTASVSQSELDLHVFDTAQYLRSRTLAVVVLVPFTMHVEDSESLDGDQTSFHSFGRTTAFTNACEFGQRSEARSHARARSPLINVGRGSVNADSIQLAVAVMGIFGGNALHSTVLPYRP
jgi:hypothetical protein